MAEPSHLLARGFRPFFLLAASFAAVIVPAWLLALSGHLALPASVPGPVWHAHEMIHGFAAAVLAGFLLTAVGNWTGRETLTGAPLGGLALLWVVGRLTSALAPGGALWTLELAFLPALSLALARPLARPFQPRNAVFPVLVLGLWAADLAVHADAAGWWPGAAPVAHRVAVHLVVVVILVITGRIVPTFTRNATGAKDLHNVPWLDRAAIGATLGLAALQPFPDLRVPGAALAALGAAAVVGRARHWGASRTLRDPLLWVLHLGHAWVAVGLALEAVSFGWPVARSPSVHAFTVGAIGLLTLGMMARVALGHTGRPLVAPRPVALGFVALQIAAVIRVFGPLLAPGRTVAWWWAAGVLWAAAFAAYAVRYLPVLVGPRADGRPG